MLYNYGCIWFVWYSDRQTYGFSFKIRCLGIACLQVTILSLDILLAFKFLWQVIFVWFKLVHFACHDLPGYIIKLRAFRGIHAVSSYSVPQCAVGPPTAENIEKCVAFDVKSNTQAFWQKRTTKYNNFLMT